MFVRVYCFHVICLSIYGHLSSCLIQQNKTNMEKNINQVVLSIQVVFWGEQGNKHITFKEQGNKRKIILRNKAIYFRGTEAYFSGEQVPLPPLGGPPYYLHRRIPLALSEFPRIRTCTKIQTFNNIRKLLTLSVSYVGFFLRL